MNGGHALDAAGQVADQWGAQDVIQALELLGGHAEDDEQEEEEDDEGEKSNKEPRHCSGDDEEAE